MLYNFVNSSTHKVWNSEHPIISHPSPQWVPVLKNFKVLLLTGLNCIIEHLVPFSTIGSFKERSFDNLKSESRVESPFQLGVYESIQFNVG